MHVAKKVAKEGGIKNFYQGIDSALLRQALYCTSRLGIYFTLTDWFKARNDGAFPTYAKVFSSFMAGALGSAIGNPADLALVRF